MTKHRFQKHLFWTEKSIRERKFRDRGSQVNQVERLHGVLGEDTTFSFHSRLHFPGSNRGDALGPINAPKWDEPRLLIVCFCHSTQWLLCTPHFELVPHPLSLPALHPLKDENETWRLSLHQKKLLFGPLNRPGVGGKIDGQDAEKSEKTGTLNFVSYGWTWISLG